MTKKNIMRASAAALAFCLLATAAPVTNVDAAAKTKLNKKKITAKVGKKKYKCKVTVKGAKKNVSNNTNNNTNVKVVTEKEVKQQEAALNQQINEFNMSRNSGIWIGKCPVVSYPDRATVIKYLKDCSAHGIPEGNKYYCYYDIVKKDQYKDDSSLKVTYTLDGTTPTFNSAEVTNQIHVKLTSQTPTVKVHIYKDGELIALDYYTEGHLYVNDGEYDNE